MSDAVPLGGETVRIRIAGMATRQPPHRVSAEDTERLLVTLFGPRDAARAASLVEVSRVRARRVIAPPSVLCEIRSAADRVAQHDRCVRPLASDAAREAMERAGVPADAIDAVVVASSTGGAAVLLDPDWIGELGLATRLRPLALDSLGCRGGVAALRIAAELVEQGRAQRVLVLGVEAPSVWLQTGEPSLGEVVAATHFGDGVGAAVVACDVDRGPQIVATRTVGFGAEIAGGCLRPTEAGPRFVATRGLNRVLRRELAPIVEQFLADCGASRERVDRWVVHPRSASMLETIGRCLQLDERALEPSRWLLAAAGNMVSASIFFLMREAAAAVGSRERPLGVVLAVGGSSLACEMALVRFGEAGRASART
jgi:alkylresorcinol/alkylpyrone synthase